MKVSEPAVEKVSIDKETMEKINQGQIGSIDLEKTEGIIFSVQLGAFSKKIDQSKFEGVPDLNMIKYSDYTRVFSGEFNNADEAVKRKKEMIDMGYKDCWIVPMKGNKRIGF